MHGTIHTGLVRLIHPMTGRFIAEYDPIRGLLKVVDRSKTAFIDLVSIDRDYKAQQEAQTHGGPDAGEGHPADR